MKVEEIQLAFTNNQKFELGLIQDLEKASSTASKSRNVGENSRVNAIAVMQKAIASFKQGVNDFNTPLVISNQIIAQAGQLGVDVPKQATYYKKIAEDGITESNQFISKIEKAIQMIGR